MFDIDEILDYINNFESKNILTSFLFTVGRSGSILLQSFIDNHPQVIIFPVHFSFYLLDSKFNSYSHNSWDYIVDDYLDYISQHYKKETYRVLGEDKNKYIYLDFEKFKILLKRVLKELVVINRKNFFLALNFIYAKLTNKKLYEIKCIFHHEHYFVTNFFLEREIDLHKLSYVTLDNIYNEFPNAKLIITIRNPLQLYNSHFNLFKDSNFVHIPYFYSSVLNQILFNLKFVYSLLNNKKYNVMIVKLEDLHKKHSEVISKICRYLELEFNDSLNSSTIGGEIWWGNTPLSKPKYGINTNFSDIDLDKYLDSCSKYFCNILFSQFNRLYEYQDIYFKDIIEDFSITLSDFEFRSLIYLIFREFTYLNFSNCFKYSENYSYNQDNIFFSEKYPILRKKILNSFKENRIDDLQENELICINDTTFFIKNIIRNSFIYPLSEGYFILFSSWKDDFLPSDSINSINSLTDQVWVPNNFIKNIYIQSGILEDKIKVVPYGVNIKYQQSIYELYKDSVLQKCEENNDNRFKFIFIGDFTYNSGVDILLEAYFESFANNDDVFLILLNLENMSDSISYTSKQSFVYHETNFLEINNKLFVSEKNLESEWFASILNKFKKRNKPDLEVINLNYISSLDINDLYSKCDCLVYPFRYDALCFRMLDAISAGLPVITTKNGPPLDFCNEDNSYLIENTIIYKSSEFENDSMDFSNNGFRFIPDKKHLSKLMLDAFKNRKNLKEKALKLKESVYKNYNWEIIFDSIYSNINDLKNKPIFRNSLDDIKNNLEIELNNYIHLKQYILAENILKKLSYYDYKYNYNLAELYIEQNNYDLALEVLINILDKFEITSRLFLLIARCFYSMGEFELAEEYYQKVKDLKD